jgi:hypothetical protein
MLIIYNFWILYIKGIKNAKINALSKKPEYFINKIYKLKAIFKKKNNLLIFNK